MSEYERIEKKWRGKDKNELSENNRRNKCVGRKGKSRRKRNYSRSRQMRKKKGQDTMNECKGRKK
jgi:hypothetical protein